MGGTLANLSKDQAYLGVIQTTEKKEFGSMLYRKQLYWVGAATKKGQWKWVDSSPIDRSAKVWAKGHPKVYRTN
jgi:hypothetical protein